MSKLHFSLAVEWSLASTSAFTTVYPERVEARVPEITVGVGTKVDSQNEMSANADISGLCNKKRFGRKLNWNKKFFSRRINV